MQERFNMLYKRQAHVHHYTKYIEKSLFDESYEEVSGLVEVYSDLERVKAPKFVPRLKPVI